MAILVDKKFDTQLGAVLVWVKDQVPGIGNTTPHTIYVAGPGAVTDVNAAVAQIMSEADAHATAILNAMAAAGFDGNPAG